LRLCLYLSLQMQMMGSLEALIDWIRSFTRNHRDTHKVSIYYNKHSQAAQMRALKPGGAGQVIHLTVAYEIHFPVLSVIDALSQGSGTQMMGSLETLIDWIRSLTPPQSPPAHKHRHCVNGCT
jgi:hypothetical protein